MMADMDEMKRKVKDMGSDAKMKAKETGAQVENMKEKANHRMQEMRNEDETADTM